MHMIRKEMEGVERFDIPAVGMNNAFTAALYADKAVIMLTDTPDRVMIHHMPVLDAVALAEWILKTYTKSSSI